MPSERASGAAGNRKLYPEIEPYNTGMLRVSETHELYFEESGNPRGAPVVFLHGGPGSGAEAKTRRFFDPEYYRIVLFDQRGAGRSRPHASLVENTTWRLVEDIETLRRRLQIERWLVFGGSWGSALGLAYSEKHVDRVSGLVLRGVFLLRRAELKWFYQSGADAIFPDAWEEFVRPIPVNQRGDLLKAYQRMLTGPDRVEQLRAARAWATWEMVTSTLIPDRDKLARTKSDEFCLAFARIECHFFIHGGFFDPENQLIDNIGVVQDIPAVVIQGRHDVVCPMSTAWELHRAWPKADFRIVHDAGDSAYEPGTVHELVSATDRLREGLS